MKSETVWQNSYGKQSPFTNTFLLMSVQNWTLQLISTLMLTVVFFDKFDAINIVAHD